MRRVGKVACQLGYLGTRSRPTGGRSYARLLRAAPGVRSRVVTDIPEESADGVSAGDVAPPPEGSTPRSLWAQLLVGRVTEVFVLTYRGLYRDLPQTLGLEVISYEAYLYDSYGVARTPSERAEIAHQLAAEPRWLAIGGPRYWVEHFAQRAEAILVMPGGITSLEVAVDSGINTALSSAGRHLAALFARSRRRDSQELMIESVAPGREFAGDIPRTDSERSAYFVQMKNYLVGEFPDKTFVLQRGGDVKNLRSVRALPKE